MKSLFAVFALLVLLSGCGFEKNSQLSEMTEDEALDVLKSVSLNDGGLNAFGRRGRVSSAGLIKILKELAESGALDHNAGVRSAVQNGGVDLNALNTLFSILNNGNVNSVFGLFRGIAASGASSGTLESILNLINAALPIISAIAPQFAPILQALTVIIPLIVNLFGGFGENNILQGGPEFAQITPIHLFLPKLA